MAADRTTELTEISLGQRGSKSITGTSAVTGQFIAIQIVADAVVSAQTDDGVTNMDLTDFTSLPAGLIVYGRWSSITLTSGEAIGYTGE